PHGATQRLGEHDDRHPEVQAELDRPMHRGSDPDIAPRPGDNGPRVEDHALRREDGSATLWSGHSRRTSSITCSGTGPYSSSISSSSRRIRSCCNCTRNASFTNADSPREPASVRACSTRSLSRLNDTFVTATAASYFSTLQ